MRSKATSFRRLLRVVTPVRWLVNPPAANVSCAAFIVTNVSSGQTKRGFMRRLPGTHERTLLFAVWRTGDPAAAHDGPAFHDFDHRPRNSGLGRKDLANVAAASASSGIV